MNEIKQVEDCKSFWKRSVGEIITYTEGSLMDIIQRARNDINSLITTIESLQKKLNTCKESWEEQKEQIRSLEHALSIANDDSKGSHYTWVPYAENHLETLSMPVLIEADWIRQLIRFETESLQKANDNFKNTLGTLHYELTRLGPLLEMSDRGYVRNTFNNIISLFPQQIGEIDNAKLKPGDRVVMVYRQTSEVWIVRSEPWDICGTECVLLEGMSGGFATEFLRKVEVPWDKQSAVRI